ncbi:hypothetical protein HBI56_024910 [Parastagonospora nodorum]|nr:hypothetical protein HBH49_072300 [Parastagonospora nodorum]KAH4195201.1 hypothetical protein HBH42_090290 [Parastagonospora nodorum]KAH4270165.1 hypothetical protein HBI03_046430 [Parastagonospora nodorum]KAH5524214.1 hypothetical protein HBI29_041430 [Parastagonospora nodorum]KAH6548806.1 hypothetical protein HBI56_024910 [Parastagonospora nodorum]
MTSLKSLPDELLLIILTEAAYMRSVKRALRLRLVCKRFANLANTAIFNSGILNCKEISDHIDRAPEFWAEYFAYLTMKYATRKSWGFKMVFLVAQHICHHRYASTDGTCVMTGAVMDHELKECVFEVYKMVIERRLGMIIHWPAAASLDVNETEVDESAIDFRRHLLSAAAWLGEESLVIKLLAEGCNWFSKFSLFLDPIRAASYRGHVDIVKILLFDDSADATHLCTRPTLVVNFYNDHTELLNLILGPSWNKCEIEPCDTRKLLRLALNYTRTLATFKRLLKNAKPHILNNDRHWSSNRTYDAVKEGQAGIVKYMIEEEGVKVSEDELIDKSIFRSRFPVEFLKGTWTLQYRAKALLSLAARHGHADIIKFLLDAGAKPDNAIEFAAMCGSRTIIRLLWEHDEYGNNAVQAAFVVAVDREDTAVFNLLKELGAKLDDDVHVALRQKAQEEGLESMVKLLEEDAQKCITRESEYCSKLHNNLKTDTSTAARN